MTTPTFTLPTSGSDPKVATKESLEENINQIIQYLDDMRISGDAALMAGLEFQGGWDASTGLFPDQDIDGNPLTKGDFFWVEVEGTFGSVTYSINEPLVAAVDSPSTTNTSDWYHAPLNPSLVPVLDSIDTLGGRIDDLPVVFDNLDYFFSNTSITYANIGVGDSVSSNRDKFAWVVASETATDHHITVNGVKYYVAEIDGARNARAYGAVKFQDSTIALQKAFDVGGKLIIDRKFVVNDTLVCDKRSLELVFTITEGEVPLYALADAEEAEASIRSRIIIGPTMPEGAFAIRVTGVGRRRGGEATEQPFFTGNERYFKSDGLFIDGNSRQYRAGGIVFEGQNDDAYMQNTWIHDVKGTAFSGGTGFIENDPVTEQTKFRESVIGDMHLKNCGDITDGRDKPAFLLFCNDEALPVGLINNISMGHMRVIYPRGVGIRVINNAPSNLGTIRSVNMAHLFLHGNKALGEGTEFDINGEPYHSGKPLMEIGSLGANNQQLAMLAIGRVEVIEQETGQPAIAVYGGSQLSIDSGYISSGPSRVGIRANGSADIVLGALTGRNVSADTVSATGKMTAPTNLIEVISMQDQASVSIGSITGGTVANNTASYIGDMKYLQDNGRGMIEYQHKGDDTAADTRANTFFGREVFATEYLNRITVIPHGNVAASDTDYATVSITRGGAPIASFSTTTSDTGNIVVNQLFELTLTGAQRLDPEQRLAIAVTKTGSGAKLPEFTIQIDTSTNVKVGSVTT